MIKQTWYILLISFIIGQEVDRGVKHNYDRDSHRSKQDRMEMMMVWRLTEGLELSTEQAEKFFPRFRDHRKKMDQIRSKIKDQNKELRGKMNNNQTLKDDDVFDIMKEVTELRKKAHDIEFEFLSGMNDLLTADQLAFLGMFKQRMLNEIKGELKGKDKRERKRGKKQKWNRRRNRF